jgi:hypothetical protein
VKGVRITSIIVVAALLSLAVWAVASGHARSTTTADSSAPGNPAAAAEPVSPPGIAQRWSLLGGDRCEWVIRNTGEAAGSRGLSIECDANPDQQLVLQVDAKVQTGGWMLRVDDGEQEPNWLSLSGYPASRVAGSKHYRFLIYSDDVGSAVSIKGVAIRPAVDTDDGLPLVWPTSGPMLEKDRQRQASRTSKGWLALVGIDEAAGVVAKAKAITNFVYQRSNIKGPPDRVFSHFGDARDWDTTPPPTVDGLCGTFTTAVLELCGKFGIAARRASLATQRFAEGNAIGDTHELAEVFDPAGGGWVLFDPSFNLTFEGPDGRLLGLNDLLAAAAEGANWRAVPIGTLRPGRTTADYYLKYEDLLWMGSAPAVPNLGDSGAAFRSRGLSVREVFRAKYPASAAP